jgi:murein DD-endopeptidase MepM/ murein hydrolase activator NlpD
VDFNGLTGRTVVAPAAGTVALAEALYVRGTAVILYHGMGVYTGYYHLSQIEVSAGQKVLPGDKVGEVGSSGLSTGSHLHWDVVVAGINVDGLAWRELTASW